MATADVRYEGKPLLRLLECYVLWAIDQLPASEEAKLRALTPKLQTVYGVKGDWPQVLAAAVHLPSNMRDMVRDLWTKNAEIARKNQTTLSPQQFAEMFVDQNLMN